MTTEREQLLEMGMPESVANRKETFSPTSVGVIVHTGDFVFEERRRLRSGEPSVLLVRQADKTLNGFHPWGIPAGRAEQGEGIIQAAVREVREETGIVIDGKRLRWFCRPGDRQAILSYKIETADIPLWEETIDHELGIKVFLPASSVNTSEIDRLALVPVEIFADHMMVGSHRHFVRMDIPRNYLYRPEIKVDVEKLAKYLHSKSRKPDEEVDFIPAMYKGKIRQEIRHQMFVGKIIPLIWANLQPIYLCKSRMPYSWGP